MHWSFYFVPTQAPHLDYFAIWTGSPNIPVTDINTSRNKLCVKKFSFSTHLTCDLFPIPWAAYAQYTTIFRAWYNKHALETDSTYLCGHKFSTKLIKGVNIFNHCFLKHMCPICYKFYSTHNLLYDNINSPGSSLLCFPFLYTDFSLSTLSNNIPLFGSGCICDVSICLDQTLLTYAQATGFKTG